MAPSCKENTVHVNPESPTSTLSATTSFSKVTEASLDMRSDAELIAAAKALILDEKLMAGLRLLRTVQDPKLFKDDEQIQYALVQGRQTEDFQEIAGSDATRKESGWRKSSEFHTHDADGIVYSRSCSRLVGGRPVTRVETPLESSLILPLLSVLNETNLFSTWTPKLTFPFRFGINGTTKHYSASKCDHICSVFLDLPWPMNQREAVVHGFASEDIAEHNRFGIVFNCITENEHVPPPSKHIVRGEGLQGGFLFQPCPSEHPAFSKSKKKYPTAEPKLLAAFVMNVDGFFTAFLLKMILRVAREVRDGKRPLHTEALKKNKGLYDWVNERVQQLLDINRSSPLRCDTILQGSFREDKVVIHS